MTINNVSVAVVNLFLILMCVSTWIINLNKLIHCDFKAPYKCEIAHGIGLIPVFSGITLWFGSDE